MLMPKAAMDEYRCSVFRQNNVGVSGQVFAVEPKSVAKFCEGLPDKSLRIRVARSNSRHVPASALYGKLVGHTK
jgi:hypothetical protein